MNNYKPSWEELRSLNIFEVINGKEYLPIESFKRFVNFVETRGDAISNLPNMYHSLRLLSREDYEQVIVDRKESLFEESQTRRTLSFSIIEDSASLKKAAIRIFSRQPGDDD